MSEIRGQATTQTQTTRPATAGLARSIHLILALLLALGATLAGAGPAGAQEAASLRLTPTSAQVDVNRAIRITASALDADNQPIDDANQKTRLSFEPDGTCLQDGGATAIVVVCQKPGIYTVVGVIGGPQVQSEPVTLEVVAEPVPPRISSVRPRSTPPNRKVVVTGTTGSCSQSGTLTLEGLTVAPQPVTGVFNVSFTVLPGVFPGSYPLELSVDCDRQSQLAKGRLRVRNRPPTAADDLGTLSGPEVRIDVTANDTDPDGDDGYQTVVESGLPLHGTAEVQDQMIVYRPGLGFVDRDQFSYRHCDVVDASGKTQCGTGTVAVTTPDPVAKPDTAVTKREQQIAILVTGNDTSPNPAKLRVRTDPKHGVAVVRERPRDGHILYTPEKDFTGEDSFEYDYCEGQGTGPNVAAPDTCPPATVTVTVEPVPVAVDDPDETTLQEQGVSILVTGNDIDPDPEKVHLRTQPKNGMAVVRDQPRDGHILYTPGKGFTGEDSFEYDYCPPPPNNLTAKASCDPATVTVDVITQVPPAIETVTRDPTPPNRDVAVTGSTGSCNRKGTLILHIPDRTDVETPVTGAPDGAFKASLKVPGGTFPRPYQLELAVDCRGKRQKAERTIRVENKAPDAVDDPARATEGTAVAIDVTANDTDPDGDDGYQTSVEPAKPARGRLDAQPGKPLVYTPEDGFTGVDQFSYRLCDIVDATGAKDCDTATVTVNVEGRSPKALPDTAETDRDKPVTIEVMRNDRNPHAARLRVQRPDRPGAKAEQQADGTVLYTPEAGFTGVDTFRYDYCAGSGGATAARGACPFATVTVTVDTPDPVPVDDPDETTMRDRPAVLDVMGNDRDPDPARLRVLDRPAPAGMAVAQPDGTIRYTPAAGTAGEDRFRYDYCGGSVSVTAARGPCPSATVTVTVTDVPVIASVTPASTTPGKPVQVVGNTGSCNRSGTLELQGAGVALTVAADQDGAFTTGLTVPAGTFPGPYRLELRVDCRGQPQRADASLTVTNKAPVAADDRESTTRDQAVRIDVTNNDSDPDDPDGYRTAVLVTSGPEHGTAQEQDLAVDYTPEPGFVGTDQFDYSLCDDVVDAAGQADCGSATVTVTVTDLPVISSVEPGSTSPGRPVQVAGNTGSCGRAGTLTFSGAAGRPMDVTGDQNGGFATSVTVPEGTFPSRYRLELVVDCKGQSQRAEAALTVVNQAPVAADDEITIAPDTATTIDVTRNDHDPDDPDTYRTAVLVTKGPDHGTAQEQDLSVRYTPAPGFVGTDQFDYSLCDDVVNAAGQADCGTATVTVRVDPVACAPSERDNPSVRVEPARGSGGTRLHITAAVARRLATCQFRFLLGGTPLPPDVSVGGDGSISADRGVPPNVKPGPNPMRLITLTAETLAQTPFEVVGAPSPPPPPPPPPNWPVRLLLSAGALAAGFLGRAAFRKWGKGDEGRPRDRPVDLPDDLRAEPHTRPVEATVEPVPDNSRTLAVRLEPHPDHGIQTLEEVTR